MFTGLLGTNRMYAKVLLDESDLLDICLFEKISGRTVLRCSMVAEQEAAISMLLALITMEVISPKVTISNSEELVEAFTEAGILVNITSAILN